jgi:arabinogalactan endo-1,4-beta-galactosidase
MTRKVFTAIFLAIASILSAQESFWLGADISAASEIEARGWKLYNANGEEREYTALSQEMGLNAVRYRVWVNPKDDKCSPNDVLQMALRAQKLGLAIMIDFHYSDWWADPGKQNIPQAWKNMDYQQMKQALAEHTKQTLQLLRDNGVEVKWVQVGNETTDGFLWDTGRASTNMEQYAGLTQAGYDAVKSVYPDAKVIVHLDAGCDAKRYDFIFDGLKQYGAKWDIIGMSVYPYWDRKAKLTNTWRETIKGVCSNIRRLAQKHNCQLMIVETGVEAKKSLKGYRIMKALIDAAKHDCEGHCKGVFYWAPEAEGQYPLGAFHNHHPTKIMKAFK